MHRMKGWSTSFGQPDFDRYYHALRTEVGSWTLEKETIWTPCWLDAYGPSPCLCASWGWYTDEPMLVRSI